MHLRAHPVEPELARALEPAGCHLTADSPHCQKNIATEIVEADAGCRLAHKGNQPADVEDDLEVWVTAGDWLEFLQSGELALKRTGVAKVIAADDFYGALQAKQRVPRKPRLHCKRPGR